MHYALSIMHYLEVITLAEFNYKALENATGKEVKGTINADNEEEALQKLKAKELTPMEVTVATAMTKSVSIGFGKKAPKPRDMSVFCRQMVSILSAGVGMNKALEMLSAQTENAVLREAIEGCRTKIEQGSSMHEAMQDFKCMRGIFATMVAAGEESGSLEISFTRMAEKFEKDAAMKALVKKSTMYPKVLIFVLLGVVVAMLQFVIPKFQDFLGSLGGELPPLTKAIVAASDFFKARWYIIAAVVAAFVFAYKTFNKSAVGRHFIDNLKLKMPLMGPLTVKTACANITRTMGTLIATGLPMLEAIEIAGSTMENIHYQEAMQTVKTDVAQGTPLSDALESTKLFPSMVYQMTRIGEETGDLVAMFDRTAGYFDDEVKAATEAMTAAMEPLIIVAMAGIVGTMVISLLMPMMSMYDNLDSLHIFLKSILFR